MAQSRTRLMPIDFGRFTTILCAELTPKEITWYQEKEILNDLQEINNIETEGLETNFTVWREKWNYLSNKFQDVEERLFFWKMFVTYVKTYTQAQHFQALIIKISARYETLMESIANQIGS